MPPRPLRCAKPECGGAKIVPRGLLLAVGVRGIPPPGFGGFTYMSRRPCSALHLRGRSVGRSRNGRTGVSLKSVGRRFGATAQIVFISYMYPPPPGWGASLLVILGQFVSHFVSARISCVSVFPHFRLPDTSVSDKYQECVLYVSVVYQ